MSGEASTSASVPTPAPNGEAEPSAPAEEPRQLTDADFDALLKEFFSDLKDVDRDNEVNRILWAFKLNPFEKLNLRFDASIEEVRKQYRKLSLMVHPDKCKHPQASTAFDVLGDAQKELMDEERRTHLLKLLDIAREAVRTERRKETKHDNLVKVAALLNEGGREGVEAAWERSDEFHEKWRLKARETLASQEWRKRKLGKRLKEETARLESADQEARVEAKRAKQAAKEWEASREQRVGTWRDYLDKKTGKAVGELKPPKQRANDEDKLYVRRPAKEEELRPPPAAPSKGAASHAATAAKARPK